MRSLHKGNVIGLSEGNFTDSVELSSRMEVAIGVTCSGGIFIHLSDDGEVFEDDKAVIIPLEELLNLGVEYLDSEFADKEKANLMMAAHLKLLVAKYELQASAIVEHLERCKPVVIKKD